MDASHFFFVSIVFAFLCAVFCSGVIRDKFYRNNNVFPAPLYKVDDFVEFYDEELSSMKTGIIIETESTLRTRISCFNDGTRRPEEHIRYQIDIRAKEHGQAVLNELGTRFTDNYRWVKQENINRIIKLCGK